MRVPARVLGVCVLLFAPLTACGTEEASLCDGVECENDGNPCTEAACDPATGLCEHVTVEDDTECDFDGLPGLCKAGVCQDAMLCEGVECEDDGNECTENACDPATGECVLTTLGDGTECSAGICQEGTCRPACIENLCHCSEIGIRAAVEAGSHDPYTFDCDGPTTVTTKDEIEIDEDVILDGEGNLTVDGNETHRVFRVSSRATVELRGMKVVRGAAREGGGGIDNAGTLTLSKVTVSSSSTQRDGGGIWNEGTLTLVDSTVADNTAEDGGGAAIQSTGYGGHLRLLNTTVSGNHPASGRAAIEIESSWALVRSSTLEQLPVGEGRYLLAGSGGIEIANTILHGECPWRAIYSQGGNIESPGDTCGLWYDPYYERDWPDVSEEQLDLGPLQDNGGPTRTHLPGGSSVAIDRIEPWDCVDLNWEQLQSDQRGVGRPLGPLCDVGSVEADSLCEGVDCDDRNECTSDRCNPADGSCIHDNVPDFWSCDLGGGGSGGSPGTGGTGGVGGIPGAGGTVGYSPGICYQGECIPDPCLGDPCDDGNDCTDDHCTPPNGACWYENVPDGRSCYLGTGGTGGAGGIGATGGAGDSGTWGICVDGECAPGGEGACTNAEDTMTYQELTYTTGAGVEETGIDAASAIGSDCVFGAVNSVPRNPGCPSEAQAVLICASTGCPAETVAALVTCVVDCQQTIIEEVTGSTLTEACATCYGVSVACSANLCATSGCSAPDSPQCIQCRCDNGCIPGFDICSGLPPTWDCG